MKRHVLYAAILFFLFATAPVARADTLDPYFCATVTPECELLMVGKWLGAQGQKYETTCLLRDMGADPHDLAFCEEFARKIYQEGWKVGHPFHIAGATTQDDPRSGFSILRMNLISCFWIRNAEHFMEHLKGKVLLAEGFFFRDMPPQE